jgi:hypothetical protein
MAYTRTNFKTKKAAKLALAEAQADGQPGIPVFQPGPFGPDVRDGNEILEGPHYPEPHRWYASAQIKDGYAVSIK